MELAHKILAGQHITAAEAYELYQDDAIDTMDLVHEAYKLRQHFYGKKVKLNMILNAKSGICPEDCGYCGQSRDMNPSTGRSRGRASPCPPEVAGFHRSPSSPRQCSSSTASPSWRSTPLLIELSGHVVEALL